MATTTNLNFTLLNGSETAGYSSINTITQSVENSLRYRVVPVGTIMVIDTGVGSVPATGWDDLGTSISGSGLPTLNAGWKYIRKNITL